MMLFIHIIYPQKHQIMRPAQIKFSAAAYSGKIFELAKHCFANLIFGIYYKTAGYFSDLQQNILFRIVLSDRMKAPLIQTVCCDRIIDVIILARQLPLIYV